jgi:hypothetical protein
MQKMLFQPEQQLIQEILYDDHKKHNLKKQTELHKNIRNDSDYDDWEYGTDANYGLSWK